jgi:hypothetical protein
MNRQSLFLATAACLGSLISSPAWGAPPKDTLVVTGLQSLGGFTPTLQGGNPEYFYATTVVAGALVGDTIPIQLDLYDTSGVPGQQISVTLNAVGQVASSISFDSVAFNMTDPQLGLMHYAYINASNLLAGNDYHANIQVSADPSSKVGTSHSTLHLLIHVIPADNISATCYITDSSGLLLNDCAGQQVNTGGKFLIITNQKKITSTNPGQFYYNLTWTNTTGSPVTFTSLGLTGSNVVPHGTNAVHVLIYDANSFTASFDDVNQSGTPCGAAGTVCKTPITVPAGQTLWLTWHVEYQYTGGPVQPGLPKLLSCPTTSQYGTISMSATLTSPTLLNPVTCGPVGANGYTLQ